MPAAGTLFCGTFTYPIAVRVARKIFRLRGFYSIHISIAPFLALIHVNILGTLHAYARAHLIEQEYIRLAPILAKTKVDDSYSDPLFGYVAKMTRKLK